MERKKKGKQKKEKRKTDNWATSAHSGAASLYSTRSPHARLPYRFCAPLADRRARSAATVTDAVLWAMEVSSVFSLATDSACDAGSSFPRATRSRALQPPEIKDHGFNRTPASPSEDKTEDRLDSRPRPHPLNLSEPVVPSPSRHCREREKEE